MTDKIKEESEKNSDSKSTRFWLLGMCLCLGGLFIFAAIAKWVDVYAFSTHVSGQLGIEKQSAGILSRILIALELAIGVNLCIPFGRKRFSLPAAFILLTVFVPYLIYLISTNDLDNCSCFGDWLPMGPISSLVKTIALLLVTAICWYFSKPSKRLFFLPLLILIPAFILVFSIKPITKTVVPKPKPGPVEPDMSAYKAQHPRIAEYKQFSGQHVDLTKGLKLICFFNASCDHCVEVAVKLNDYNDIPIYYILLGDNDQAEVFFLDAEKERPFYADADDERFFDISDSPPYLILSKDNYHVQDWNYDSFTLEKLKAKIKELNK